MKVKFLFVCLLASFCLLSCNKDDDPAPEPEPTPEPTPIDDDTPYSEPVLAWGMDEEYVKEHQKQGTLSEVVDSVSSDMWSITYYNARHYRSIEYTFYKGELVLVWALVELKDDYKAELLEYLNEHYTPLKDIDWNSNYMYFVGTDGKTLEESKTVVGLSYRIGAYMKQKFIPVSRYHGVYEPWHN